MRRRWPLRSLWLVWHRFFWTHTWEHYANAMRCTACGEVVVLRKNSQGLIEGEGPGGQAR